MAKQTQQTPPTALKVLEERAGCLGVFEQVTSKARGLIYLDSQRGNFVYRGLNESSPKGVIFGLSSLNSYTQLEIRALTQNEAQTLASLLQEHGF